MATATARKKTAAKKQSVKKTTTRKATIRKKATNKYGKAASEKVKDAMEEFKEGSLTSGRSGKKVTSRKQAIAIGLSEARAAGAKVPQKKT